MKKYLPFILAVIATIPGLTLRLAGIHLDPISMTIITAIAIFSASFILTWCCEVMQIDIPQAVAVALVALIAVLPEYAVDMYFTWMAGQNPESDYVHYAIANMTGANRLLIGVGWSVVILIYVFKYRKKVVLEKSHKTELFFLVVATCYAFTIPAKGALNLFDSVILIGLFVWYIVLIIRKPVVDEPIEGPAKTIAALPKKQRLAFTWGLFVWAALVILADAEIFSESIVASGKLLGINEFLLVQWLAPVASEAPEFIIAVTFALRGQAGIALGSLVSSKLNQWTLLVGMIPVVYAISSGSLTHMPLGPNQLHELLLTAAQSIFALGLICGLIVGRKEAFFLLALFILQFASPLYFHLFDGVFPAGVETRDGILMTFSGIYIIIAAILIAMNWRCFYQLIDGLKKDEE